LLEFNSPKKKRKKKEN